MLNVSARLRGIWRERLPGAHDAEVVGCIVVLGIAADAAAQPRPNTLQMSCREARALVVSHGAIVLGTGPNRYERYVRDQSFCPVGNWFGNLMGSDG